MPVWKRNNIIFFGTSEFALLSLKALHIEGYNIILVVTMPDKPVGRKQVLTPSVVKVEAQNLGLEIIDNLEDLGLIIKAKNPNVGIVVSYGKIIPKNIIDLFPYGCINIHPSLLPKYRGPSPMQAAILNGDGKTGVSIIKLDEKMDHGPLLSQIAYRVSRSDNYKSLSERLADVGSELLIKALPEYLAGKTKLKPQNDKQATFTKILKREDGKIDWNKSAVEIERQIRAYYPWPGSFSRIAYRESPARSARAEQARIANIKFISVRVAEGLSPALPGTCQTKNGQLYVQCGKGSLLIDRLQLEGKKEMSGKDFIRGYQDKIISFR